jgi:hypothetical protein
MSPLEFVDYLGRVAMTKTVQGTALSMLEK